MPPFKLCIHTGPCRCSIPLPPTHKATAKWIHGHLMKMDWVSRHEHFHHLEEALTIGNLMQVVRGLFGPDDLLSGTCTGSDLAIPVIILEDKIRKRQLTIYDFFVKKQKAQP